MRAVKGVVPRELAVRDVDDAIDHYLVVAGAHVAMGFVDELERAYAHIARHPASGSPRYAHQLGLENLRFWPLRRSPIWCSTSRAGTPSTSGAYCTNSVTSRHGSTRLDPQAA